MTLCNPMDFQAKILEWVAIPFSMGSSQPRDQTQVSRIAGGCFTSWATREALILLISDQTRGIKGSDSPLTASFA